MVKAIGHASPIAARNSAILLFGWATALQRSNLAALRLEHLTFTPKGILVRIDREKQDRKDEGRELAAPFGKRKRTCPVRTIQHWLDVRGDGPGPLFCHVMKGRIKFKPLLGNRIAQIVQDAATKVGLDRKRYGAHSLRAGMATEGLEQGVKEVMIAQQTGHRIAGHASDLPAVARPLPRQCGLSNRAVKVFS
jgi:integrase